MAVDQSLFYKDPDETLDYMRDWTLRLGDDTIETSSWTVIGDDNTLTVDSESFSDTTATVFLSGGRDGYVEEVTNHVVTYGGREFDKTFLIKIRPN